MIMLCTTFFPTFLFLFWWQGTDTSILWTHWHEFCPDQILRLLQEWLFRQHLDIVTYHNWFWLHICPSCHTESQTWAFFFIQDYEVNIFFILVKRNRNKYIPCARVRKFWCQSSHSTAELVTTNPSGSLGTSTQYWKQRGHHEYPALLLGGAYVEFWGSIL